MRGRLITVRSGGYLKTTALPKAGAPLGATDRSTPTGWWCQENTMQTQNRFDPDPFYDSQEWRRLRAAVLKRDHYQCQYCGDEGNQADHIIPRKKRGGDALDNLVCSCSWCNGVALNKRFP